MSVFAAFHSIVPLGARRTGTAPAAPPVTVARQPADPFGSPLEYRAADQPSTAATRLRAHWRTVTAPDGTNRLEAAWSPDR
jgi:hypothetical protein